MFHRVIHILYRCINGVDRDHPDGLILFRVGGNIASAGLNNQFHLEAGIIIIKCRYMEIGVDNLYCTGSHNIGCSNFTLPANLQSHRHRMIREGAQAQFFNVQHDISDIFHHTLDILKLVLYTFNPYRGYRCAW